MRHCFCGYSLVRLRAELLVQYRHNGLHLRACNAVVNVLALAPGTYQAFVAQYAQLLRQGGLAYAHQFLQFADVLFVFHKLAQQQKAVGVGQHLHEAARLAGGLAQGIDVDQGVLHGDVVQ